jgi:peptide/nickel transport system ATP-binding protein
MIELEGIRKSFGNHEVLRGCGLSLAKGDAVAVIGQSGSGKTTLGRILLRLLEPTSGAYRFDGVDVVSLRGRELRDWRHKVQAVFQNPWESLNPRQRVWQLVSEPLYIATGLRGRKARDRAEGLLDEVGLPSNFVDYYPRQLSGGQRQRVAIARALSVRPELLVLDEPVSSLDVSLRSQILLLVKDLVKRYGTTVLYITHDIVTIPYLCSRTYVLYEGTVMEELEADQLVSGPDNPYTCTLRNSVVALGSELSRHTSDPGGRPDAVVAGDRSLGHATGCVFASRCDYAVERCREVAPALEAIAGRHDWRSRCHFAGAPKVSSMESRS